MSVLALMAALSQPMPVSIAQPMGPWLDEAHSASSNEPVQKVGQCAKNHLSGGVRMPHAPELYKLWMPEKAWGRPEMVEVLTRASEEMAWLIPEADPIVIGDISTRYGGHLEGHKSHRAGVDADIGLYWGDGRMHMGGFRDVHPNDLDLEANWLLIKSLLDTGLVERILLDQHLIRRIKLYTIESGELTPEEADEVFPIGYSRMWTHTGVVHHAPSHKEHMHVRTFCWVGA